MIFVPASAASSTTNPRTPTPPDLAAGTRVLVEVLEALANR
jgi:N-carbamoyl-L-amino-acid hydrolase